MKVAGIDSSTQSTKVLVVDGESGVVLRCGHASHPSGTEVDPAVWWDALRAAIADAGGIGDCAAVSIAGQQHGMVCLDARGEVIRPALLWNDTRSSGAARDLIREQSAQFWVEATGSAPVASLTITKLRWLADAEPANAAKIAAICLPHDWLTWKLSGSVDIHDLVTDRSDASGTGYVDVRSGEYRYDLLAQALRISEDQARAIVLPRIAEPFEIVGVVASEYGTASLGAGCGDNAGAALALGLKEGTASLSLGTSGVIATVAQAPALDPAGEINSFMDATGKWLPLACTLNGSRIIDYVKDLLGLSYRDIDHLAEKGNSNGLVLIPYFEGERTPNMPSATATLFGLTPVSMNKEAFARSACEAMCCLMRGALEALKRVTSDIQRAVLVGGGAKSSVLPQLMADIMGIPISIPTSRDALASHEFVARGAAWQAARTVLPNLAVWPFDSTVCEPSGDGGDVWERYQQYSRRYSDWAA